jgi:predicted nucleic acid-binding protein
MGWVETLRGEIIGLDTAPLIYYIEENPKYLSTLQPFFEALDRREFSIVTSTITLLEVLVHPIRQNNHQLVQQYRNILSNAVGIEMFPLDINISEYAAQLRGEYNIRTPDAIQMATAIQAGATYFLTNDIALPEIPDLRILVVENL